MEANKIMKYKRVSQENKQAVTAVSNGRARPLEVNSTLFNQEVAKMAYFTYVHEGSPQGRDMQHWLDAEARCIKDAEPGS